MLLQDLTVQEIMDGKGPEVLTIHQTSSVKEAARSLSKNRIGILVVTGSEGRFVGVLSERDIVHAVGAGEERDIGALKVEALMTEELITCDPKACPIDVLDAMEESKIRHMPVMQDGSVVGLLSRTDIINHLRQDAQSDDEEFLWHKLLKNI